MKTPHQEIRDITYEIYSEEHDITYNQFLDKVTEEDFEEYYETVLWSKATKEYNKRLKEIKE